MAVYKVAQDVEADDKLIGPFSFRQFIYLIIVAISMALAWGLAQLFIGLAIIPLPIIIFFGALALPLRKDQPMEIYMAAIVSYHLKPRRRLWIPDGIESLVQITSPKFVEVQRTKNLSQTEAEKRLSYLADIADTGGWSIRNSVDPFVANSAMATDAFFAAQQTEDVLGEDGGIAHSFDTMISQSDQRRKEEMMARMHETATAPAEPQASAAQTYQMPAQAQSFSSSPQPAPDEHITFNPYPTEIHQMVINPIGSVPLPQPAAQLAPQPRPIPQPEPATSQAPVPTSEKPISPDIINLASNPDLSIETIQREADRIQKKQDEDDSDEVFVSLR